MRRGGRHTLTPFDDASRKVPLTLCREHFGSPVFAAVAVASVRSKTRRKSSGDAQ